MEKVPGELCKLGPSESRRMPTRRGSEKGEIPASPRPMSRFLGNIHRASESECRGWRCTAGLCTGGHSTAKEFRHFGLFYEAESVRGSHKAIQDGENVCLRCLRHYLKLKRSRTTSCRDVFLHYFTERDNVHE